MDVVPASPYFYIRTMEVIHDRIPYPVWPELREYHQELSVPALPMSVPTEQEFANYMNRIKKFQPKKLSPITKRTVNAICKKLDNRLGDYVVDAIIRKYLTSITQTRVETQVNPTLQPTVVHIFKISPPIPPGRLMNEKPINYIWEVNELDVIQTEFVAANWRNYQIKKTLYTIDIFSYRHVVKDIPEFDGLRIQVPYYVPMTKFAQKRLHRKFMRNDRNNADRNAGRNDPPGFELAHVPEYAPTVYVHAVPTVSVNNVNNDNNDNNISPVNASDNKPHGILDLFPNKIRVGFNQYIVTTFGNGCSTQTEVTVDGDGNPTDTKYIKLSRSNDFDDDLEFDSTQTPQVAVKLCDNFPTDHYFVYKALETAAGMPCIAKLKVSINAQVAVTKFETKARCSEAMVIRIFSFILDDGNVTFVDSLADAYNFVYTKKRQVYTVGETYSAEIIAENLRNDPHSACSSGIHFCFTIEDTLRFHRIYTEDVTNPEVFT